MPRQRKSVSSAASPPLGAATVASTPLTLLLRAAQTGVVLILLTPFIVSTETLYPFVVGKSLYWRTLVEIVFALWVLLALWAPQFRPPRSWLLGLIGVGFACSVLSALFGVSLQRSLWSTYERMQGVIDGAHVLAFAVVVVSLFRGAGHAGAQLRLLLAINVCVGIGLCLLAVAALLQLEVPFYGRMPERDYPRIGSALGNAVYLAAYTTMNGALALGFLARSLLVADTPKRRRWAAALFWFATAALNYAVLALTVSRSGILGILAACVFLAVGGLWAFTRIRLWQLVVGFAGAGALAAGLGLVAVSALTTPERASALSEDGTEPFPIVGAYFQDRSARSRMAAWNAGLQGVAARPLLGWGPENFLVVFGRFQPGTVTRMEVHDLAHNKVIDEAVAKGLPGAVSYLALWLLAFYFMLRATRRLPPGERVLVLVAGAALMGYFAQSQTAFDTVSMNIQYILIICYAAWLEVESRGDAAARPRRPAAVGRWRQALAAGMARLAAPTRIAVASAAVALAVLGVVVNQRILTAAGLIGGQGTGATLEKVERGIAAFKPLANEGRMFFFNLVRSHWRGARVRNPDKARRVLGEVDAQAQAAVASEPENWLLHHYLARVYLRLATTEPDYRRIAAHYIRSSYALAPKQDRLTRLGSPLPRLGQEVSDGFDLRMYVEGRPLLPRLREPDK